METDQTGSRPKKIAVLGGGLASLSAVYELTDQPNWQDHYDITLYQIGWRLGGKTATGRSIHNRIEERGIHIFQGWYDNAFRMLKDAYRLQEELGLNPESPLKKWTDAFLPDNATLFTEWSKREGKWINWPFIFPLNDQEPGTGSKAEPWDIIRKGLAIAMELVAGEPYKKNESRWGKWLMEHLLDTGQHFGTRKKIKLSWWDKQLIRILKLVLKMVGPPELKYLVKAHSIAQNELPKNQKVTIDGKEMHSLEAIVHLVSKFTEWFRARFRHSIEKHDRLRRIMQILEWIEACFRGLMEDLYDPATHTFNFEKINDEDYRAWLKKHGATDFTLECALVRFMYTGAFANLLNGGTGQLAADIGLRMVLKSVDYKGCLVWKLAAGTGDTIITPIYQVLKERGVKFRFFHKIMEIHQPEGKEIERITVGEQVELGDTVKQYDPFIKVNGINSWPSKPLYEQLNSVQAEKLKAGKVDLESEWNGWENARTYDLVKGQDFDQVLLGIPVAALKTICKDITEENERWKNMVEKVATTQTIQVQIWTKPNLAELGMKDTDWGMAPGNEPNSVVYADYLYSWTDMTLILKQENWPEGHVPGHLSYWCGTVPDPVPVEPFTETWFPKAQLARVMGISEQWLLDNGGWLWPNATSMELPAGFNFDLMSNPWPEKKLSPMEKFSAQYYAINIDPSNRYTLALPGTNKYRMKADATDFDNLYLTGDWTDFGFNVGHMEGAVASGLKAANAILKSYGLESNKEIFE